MVLKPNLPLPKGYFSAARLSADQERQFRDIVRRRLESALRDEHQYVHVDKRQMDAVKWKLVKKKHQLRIFRRRRAPSSVTADEDTWRPTMMSVGRMEGTLEDLIYGSYDKSHEEMKTTLAYADVTAKDSTVLHNLELATPDDPFHYMGLKWLLTQLPGSLVVRPRDWCYIEAMGIKRDTNGRFGYIILHSVDLENCPPFDHRAVVRGRTQLSFIFREAVPGIVEIFAQSIFEPAGELVQLFTTTMTSEVLAGVFMMTKCAEAKKLTLLALRNARASSANMLSNMKQPPKRCSVCNGSGPMFSTLKPCRICGVTVCSQCRVKKKIFVGPKRVVCKIACCFPCLTQAQNMEIRPAEPAFSILGEMTLPPEQFATTESSEDSTPRQHHQDSTTSNEYTRSGGGYSNSNSDVDDLSELDVNGYRFSIDSGMSEDDVEKLIAAKMSQRAKSSSSNVNGGRRTTIDAPAAALLLEHEAPPVASEPSEPEPSEPELQVDDTERERARTLEQAALYEKILQLQGVADEVYTITQANNAMMLKSFT